MKQQQTQKELTQDRLKEILDYNPDTGEFTWKLKRRGVGIGKAGDKHSSGYARIKVDGKRYYAHRLAFLWMTGELPKRGQEVDHINHIRDDNRWENLRLVDHRNNRRNSSRGNNNKSGITGVCWNKEVGKWHVFIEHKGATKYLGLYSSFDTAVKVRKCAEEVLGYHPNHGKSRDI